MMENRLTYWLIGFTILQITGVTGLSRYCTKTVENETWGRPTKSCEGLEYTVVSSGKIKEPYEDTKACCHGYYGTACSIPECSCEKGEICNDDRMCTCPSKKYRDGRCVHEPCNGAIDCFPGTCAQQGGNTCTCASGFTHTNSSNADCAKVGYGPTLSSCRIIMNGKTYDANCDRPGEQTNVAVYASSLPPIYNLTVQFSARYSPPADTPSPSGMISSSKIGIAEISVNLETVFTEALTADNINSIPCLPNPSYMRQSSFNCSRFLNFTGKQWKEHSLRIHASAGGYRVIEDTTSINKTLTKSTTIFTINIKPDTTPPSCSSKPLCREIAICPDITVSKEEFTVEWSEWDDVSGIATYNWSIFELTKNGRYLDQAPVALSSGSWQPGQDYPKYLPQKSGMYAALLKVTDNAGNSKTVRTWVLYDPHSTVEIAKPLPISLDLAFEESRYQWMSDVTAKGLTYHWKDSFVNQMHEEGFLLPIATNPIYTNMFNKRASVEHKNSRGIVNFEYSHSLARQNIDDKRLRKPGDWLNAYLNESVTVGPFSQNDGDTIYFWVRATDIMGNSAMAMLVTIVDSTPPMSRLNNSVDTTPPINGIATYGPETNKPINGIPQFTTSILTDIQDKESGIGWADIELRRESSLIFEGTAPCISYTSAECPSPCYCINATGQCFPYTAEALINNCLFLDNNTTDTVLSVTFKNQAGLPSNKRTIQINEDLSNNSALNNYPAPVDIKVQNETKNSATLLWKYYNACYKKVELQIMYSGNQDTQNYTKNLTLMTSSFDQVDLTNLTSNTKYEAIFILIYEGNNASTSKTISFQTKRGPGLREGAIAGIVIGSLALLVLVLLLVRYKDKWTPTVTKFIRNAKSDFPFESTVKRAKIANRPLPTLPRTIRNTKPTEEIKNDSKIYDNEERSNFEALTGIRTVLSHQYDILEELGRGKLAVVKSAVLRDITPPQRAAAKLNLPSATEDQQLLLWKKLKFLAKEVPPHLNIVNFMAADLSVPILFMEECDQGPLANYLKSFRSFNEQVSETLINFCKDIASALVHLHSNKIIHKRLGIRNVMLASTTSNRVVAKVTGFGPVEVKAESNANKIAIPIPIRWMPPEYFQKQSKLDYVMDKSLDMWTYGITLWEMYSRGEMPYKTMKTNGIKMFILSGQRLAKPEDCPEILYNNIILPCWDKRQNSRPSAQAIVSDLDNFFPATNEPNIQDTQLDIYDN